MVQQRRGTERRPTSPPPMTPNEVLRLDNVVKNLAPPKELKKLKSPYSFTVPAASGTPKLEDLSHKVKLPNGMSAWRLDGNHKIIRGLPIREFIQQKGGSHVDSPTLPLPPPRRPDWADQIYHPKVLPRTSQSKMRRRSGKRTRPHGFIFNGDDRTPFFPSGYPWQCIGRLDVYSNPYSFVPSSWGTGTLVGPNTVLTASHVVPWDANPAMVSFTPAFFDGTSTLGPDVSSFVVDASSYDASSSPAVAFDFAVLRLDDRLGDSLGWFGSKSYDDGWNDSNFWTLVGYPFLVASGNQPSFQLGISFHDDDEDSNDFGQAMELETHDADSSGGDSGGPYFALWDGLPYVVGVDHGGETEFVFDPFKAWPFEDENNVAAAGPAMVQLIQWARDNWG
jgi:V8-like Glu-specific endopeptidase